MNSSRTSLIDDRTDLNGGCTSDRKYKLEGPEMEETSKIRKHYRQLAARLWAVSSRSRTITARQWTLAARIPSNHLLPPLPLFPPPPLPPQDPWRTWQPSSCHAHASCA